MKVTLKAKLDTSGIKDLRRRLRKLNGKSIEWGFLEGTHSTADMTYAALAEILEYGTRSNNHGYAIPPRPAFRSLITKLQTSHAAYEAEVGKHYSDFIEGRTKTPYKIFTESGEHVVGRHKDTMYSWVSDGSINQDNSEITIEMKGFNMPFVESSELVQNVTYKIN